MFILSKIIAVALLLACTMHTPAHAKVFQRCELARLLQKWKVPRSHILEWVCIAEFESSFNTHAINRQNSDGSWDWGLFQINDRYWCDGGKTTSNMCKIKCHHFQSSNIYPEFSCARRVRQIHGFAGWVAWRHRCQGYVPSKQATAKCF